MSPDDKRHGSPAGYRYGCRCDPCRDTNSRRYKRYRMRALAAGGSTTVAAAPYAEILADLAERMSMSAIGRSLDTSHTWVAKVIRGEIERINPKRAWDITQLGDYRPTDTSHVTPLGALRRLQALHAIGYTWRTLADETGYSLTGLKTVIYQQFPVIEAVRDQAIRDAYARLSMTLPTSTDPHVQGAITSARKRAAENGWPPPLAWPDEHIDDPDYTPSGWEYVPPSRAEQFAELAAQRAGVTQVCAQLKLSRKSLEKWAERNGVRADYAQMVARETAVFERGQNQHTKGAA